LLDEMVEQRRMTPRTHSPTHADRQDGLYFKNGREGAWEFVGGSNFRCDRRKHLDRCRHRGVRASTRRYNTSAFAMRIGFDGRKPGVAGRRRAVVRGCWWERTARRTTEAYEEAIGRVAEGGRRSN
jgi:hypothetical protein